MSEHDDARRLDAASGNGQQRAHAFFLQSVFIEHFAIESELGRSCGRSIGKRFGVDIHRAAVDQFASQVDRFAQHTASDDRIDRVVGRAVDRGGRERVSRGVGVVQRLPDTSHLQRHRRQACCFVVADRFGTEFRQGDGSTDGSRFRGTSGGCDECFFEAA